MKPKLYEVLIIRWNIQKVKSIKNQIKGFKELNEELKKTPSIQFYICYWPQKAWEPIIYPNLDKNLIINLTK